jgi:hypothetical protein
MIRMISRGEGQRGIRRLASPRAPATTGRAPLDARASA